MAEIGKKRRTQRRILDAALAAFNGEGEANVTTNAIADSIEMSPGTLHYHFKTKEELVYELFGQFDRELSDLLDAKIDVAGAFGRGSKQFEIMWKYRFVYRDLSQLLFKYPSVKRAAGRLLHRKIDLAQQSCRFLGVPNDRGQADALARNIVVVMTYWIGFEAACGIRQNDSADFGRGAYQVAMLVLPYLDQKMQETVLEMFVDYSDG